MSDSKCNFQDDKNRVAEEIAEALDMIHKGKLLEAMECLQQKINAASSGREKILWRLAVARLLLKVKKYELALPHLDQIIREIDIFHLENYDSALALKGLKMVCEGLESQNDESLKSKKRKFCIGLLRLIWQRRFVWGRLEKNNRNEEEETMAKEPSVAPKERGILYIARRSAI